jgi:hypothetical protein
LKGMVQKVISSYKESCIADGKICSKHTWCNVH